LLWLARVAATMRYLGIFRNFAMIYNNYSGSLHMNIDNIRDALQVIRNFAII